MVSRREKRCPENVLTIAGPAILSALNRPIYFPRSPGVAMSETHPLPIAITAEPPVACTIRITRSSQYAEVGVNAKPIHAPTYMERVTM